jgi:CxxC-x17-CxxC domain-containing protein
MEAEGTAITFVAYGEEEALALIKAHTSTRITELKTSVKVKAGPPEKHRAICRKCRTEFELPFKPTDGRPVYCLPCLKSRKRHYRRRH